MESEKREQSPRLERDGNVVNDRPGITTRRQMKRPQNLQQLAKNRESLPRWRERQRGGQPQTELRNRRQKTMREKKSQTTEEGICALWQGISPTTQRREVEGGRRTRALLGYLKDMRVRVARSFRNRRDLCTQARHLTSFYLCARAQESMIK
jgi:hypothetical protein